MKKVLLIILSLITFGGYSQISDALTQDTIDLYIVTNSMRTITAAKLNTILSHLNLNKVHVDSVGWVRSVGGDAISTDADTVYMPNLKVPGGKFQYIMGIDPEGRLFPQPGAYALDTLLMLAADSGSVFLPIVRDTTYGTLEPATSGDKITEQALNDPFYNLDYWKVDFVGAYYSKTSNAKMAIMGDSYTHRYGDKLKQRVGNIYGWGGGYETFEGNTAFETYGTNKFSTSGWTYVSITSDPYIVHSRAIRSVSSGSSYYLSSKEWNKVRIHYKKRSGGGTFTVKKGSGGTPASVDTDAAAGDGWYVKDYGNVTYNQFDTLFITSSDADSIDIYGFQFIYNVYNETYPNFESQNRRVEVSLLSDGGANIKDFYENKDTAKIHALLDTLDLSLMCFVNLDDSAGVATELDSLITLLQGFRPEMDICILSPHDEKNDFGNKTTPIMERVAKSKGVAYIDVNRAVGSMEDLIAVGAMTDSVHLTGAGDYFPAYAIFNRLFPTPDYQSTLTAYSLKLMGNTAIVKPNGTNFIWSSKPLKSTFTGTENTFIGYRSGEKTTTGGENTFVGYQTGLNNTTGFANTIIGKNAYPNLSTGYYNVSIGIASLYTAGGATRECTAVGGYALYKASTNSLTAFGYAAAKFNTGAGTVAVGYNSLLGVDGSSSGAYNTAVGSEALKATTTGASNTSIGLQSMITNTTGSDNAAFGRDALRLNLSGTSNTGIGRASGYSNSTGSGNIFVGYRAGYNEPGSYKSYWAADSTSWANGMASTSKLLWYGDMSNADKANHFMNIFAKVAIGEAKALSSYSLEVVGNANITTSATLGTFLKLTPISSAPASPEEGMIYYDSDDHALYVYNGSTWQQIAVVP